MLTLQEADRLAAQALEAAAGHGARVAVVVVDGAGHVVRLSRMDGVGYLSTRIAEAKARTAAALGRPTAATQERAAAAPALYATLAELSGGPMLHVPGGVPLQEAGTVVGAVGVSGGTPDQDQAIAQSAVDARPTRDAR